MSTTVILIGVIIVLVCILAWMYAFMQVLVLPANGTVQNPNGATVYRYNGPGATTGLGFGAPGGAAITL